MEINVKEVLPILEEFVADIDSKNIQDFFINLYLFLNVYSTRKNFHLIAILIVSFYNKIS